MSPEEQEHILGNGQFGSVRRSILKNKPVAIKRYNHIATDEVYKECFDIEVKLLTYASRDMMTSVLPLLLEVIEPDQIVMELLGPNLLSIQLAAQSSTKDEYMYPAFKLKDVKMVARCVSEAVRFLNTHGYVHADLKLENIVLANPNIQLAISSENGVYFLELGDAPVKVIDLNSAELIKTCPFGVYMDSSRQTAHYRAPEIVYRYGFDEKCDVWSLGCVLMELHEGHLLFPGIEDSELAREHIDCFSLLPRKLMNWQEENLEPRNQLQFDTNPKTHVLPLIQHFRITEPEICDFYDLIVKIFKYEPQNRPSFDEILNFPFLNN